MHSGVSDTLCLAVDALFAKPEPAPRGSAHPHDLPVISRADSYLYAEKITQFLTSKHKRDWIRPEANHPPNPAQMAIIG